MPIWEFYCDGCDSTFEEILNEKPLYIICPKCSKKANNIFPTKMSFKLVGEGWGKDLYSKKRG